MMGVTVNVTLPCISTQSSAVLWTRNTTRGYFSYVYGNGTVVKVFDILTHAEIPIRFSMVNSSSLKIYNVLTSDSGLYNCFETGGRRIVGYDLTVTRMLLIVSESK